MTRILVAIDGSAHSETVIRELLKISGLYRDPVELHVLNVQPPVPYGHKIASVLGQDQIQQYHQEQGRQALQSSLDQLDAAGVSYRPHIAVGDPAEAILEFAAQQGCSQIFMGTRGMGAVSGILMGSVASKVVHLSRLPVTLVSD